MNSQITLSQSIDGFFIDRGVRLKPRTQTNYRWAFDKLRAWFDGADPALASVVPRDIVALLDHFGTVPHKPMGLVPRPAQVLSGKSLLNLYNVYSSLWEWAVREGYATENILRRVEAPAAEVRAVVPFSEEDCRAMMRACMYAQAYAQKGTRCANKRPTAERDKSMLLLLLDTGMRATELCDLLVHHVDLKNCRVKVFGKRSRERICSISGRTAKAIWRYLQERPQMVETDPLFVQDRTEARPLNRHSVFKLIQRLGRRAEVAAAHPHKFRHTFAINFLRNGGDIFSLKAQLGHSSWAMVNRYLALAQADVESAHRRASPVANWRL